MQAEGVRVLAGLRSGDGPLSVRVRPSSLKRECDRRAEDAVVRRRRFEAAHPEAVILPSAAGRWRAVVPPGLIPGDGTRTTLGAWDLGGLMDQLEEIYPPDGSGR